MESGTILKVTQAFSPLSSGSVGRLKEETLISSCFESLASQVCRSGGVDSAVVERLFSAMRALGLRDGYWRKCIAYVFFMFQLFIALHFNQ